MQKYFGKTTHETAVSVILMCWQGLVRIIGKDKQEILFNLSKAVGQSHWKGIDAMLCIQK